jgi:hypothetical protein
MDATFHALITRVYQLGSHVAEMLHDYADALLRTYGRRKKQKAHLRLVGGMERHALPAANGAQAPAASRPVRPRSAVMRLPAPIALTAAFLAGARSRLPALRWCAPVVLAGLLVAVPVWMLWGSRSLSRAELDARMARNKSLKGMTLKLIAREGEMIADALAKHDRASAVQHKILSERLDRDMHKALEINQQLLEDHEALARMNKRT